MKKLLSLVAAGILGSSGVLLWLRLWQTSSVIGTALVYSAEMSTPYEATTGEMIGAVVLLVGSALSIYLALILIKNHVPRALAKTIICLPIATSISLVALFPLCGYFALYPAIPILIFAYSFKKKNLASPRRQLPTETDGDDADHDYGDGAG